MWSKTFLSQLSSYWFPPSLASPVAWDDVLFSSQLPKCDVVPCGSMCADKSKVRKLNNGTKEGRTEAFLSESLRWLIMLLYCRHDLLLHSVWTQLKITLKKSYSTQTVGKQLIWSIIRQSWRVGVVSAWAPEVGSSQRPSTLHHWPTFTLNSRFLYLRFNPVHWNTFMEKPLTMRTQQNRRELWCSYFCLRIMSTQNFTCL